MQPFCAGGLWTRDALEDYQRAIVALADAAGCGAQLSSYAVDTLPAGISKRAGAHVAMAMLVGDQVPAPAVVFGDSPGDVEIAEQAAAEGVPHVVFVWLGELEAPATSRLIDIERPAQPFAAGATEVLRALRTA